MTIAILLVIFNHYVEYSLSDIAKLFLSNCHLILLPHQISMKEYFFGNSADNPLMFPANWLHLRSFIGFKKCFC